MKRTQGITERLKESNALEWTGKINNLRAYAMEIVEREIIYTPLKHCYTSNSRWYSVSHIIKIDPYGSIFINLCILNYFSNLNPLIRINPFSPIIYSSLAKTIKQISRISFHDSLFEISFSA